MPGRILTPSCLRWGGVVLLLWIALAVTTAAGAERQSYHRENVLGTSLDLTVVADDEAAGEAALDVVLAEIARLDAVLSTWRADSEIRRLPSDAPVAVSEDLAVVLDAAERFRQATRGAFNPLVGELIRTWQEASRTGTPPDPVALAKLARQIQRPATRPVAGNQLMVHDPSLLAIDGLAKGYIIDRALAAVMASPGVHGAMLDIGGDLATAGSADGASDRPWEIGVADPARSAENASPATRLALRGQAVASSGSYARPLLVGGVAHSHIIDPRSGRAVDAGRAATVVAPDAMTADALATALCVLDPQQGLAIAQRMPGIAAMVWDGQQSWTTEPWPPQPGAPEGLASSGEASSSEPVTAVPTGPIPVTIDFALTDSGRRPRKPYVVVWISTASGEPVRTVEVWGQELKYQRDLRDWWRSAGSDMRNLDSVTRASRRPGQYSISWDGRDDAGDVAPPGSYVVHLEVAREHAGRWSVAGPLTVGPDPDAASTAGDGDIVRLMVSSPGSRR